jgi:hypothetical protein
MKPVAYMKGEVLETLHPQDCFYAFASPAKGATIGLYTEDQVRELWSKLHVETGLLQVVDATTSGTMSSVTNIEPLMLIS